MKRGHVPIRMCRGCGRRAPKQELVRFIWDHGEIREDASGNMPGRGVYCCENTVCRTRLLKKKNMKILKQALRLQLDKGILRKESSRKSQEFDGSNR